MMAIDSVLWVRFVWFGDLSDRANWTEFPPSVIYYSEQLFRNSGAIHWLPEVWRVLHFGVELAPLLWLQEAVPDPA